MVPIVRHLLLFLFLLQAFASSSQNASTGDIADRPLRVEIPVRSANETYRIIPVGTKGAVLFYRSIEGVDNDKVKWYFTCYDTNLLQAWVRSIPLASDHDYRFHQQGKDTLALLFVHSGKTKGVENSFEILRIVLKNGAMILNRGPVDEGASVVAFGLQKDRAWLGVNEAGRAGRIINLSLKKGTIITSPLGYGDQISVIRMTPDSSSYTATALVGRQMSKKLTEYFLATYDTTGAIRREIPVGKPAEGLMLNDARVITTVNGGKLLLGCYGQGVSGSQKRNLPVEESTGIFAAEQETMGQQPLNLYNFLELHSAGSVVGEQDIMNLKKKALKKKKPLSEYSLDYSVMLHDILDFNGQYLLTAELFTPQYHTESFTDFDFYGRPFTNTYSVFDGYRFFSAIVAGFDAQGRLIWDNQIEIRNLLTFDLTPKVVIFPSGNELVLCYTSDGKIASKIIRESEVIEKLDFSVPELMNPGDNLSSESKCSMVRWYGDYFLTFGYQEIKNLAISSEKRFVYFFSKLRFDR